VVAPAWGEIWWGEAPDEKPRPYLVLTRDGAIGVLKRLVVAPVTRSERSIPTEVTLGATEGLAVACVASMDNVTIFEKAHLVRRMGVLDRMRKREVCSALAAVLDC